MDRLTERLALASKALDTLEAVLREPKSAIVRDASIQRFEYSFEAVWKAAQLYLRVSESLALGSPKAVVRASMQLGLLDAEESRTALVMVDDRNLTVHTYNEDLSEAIYSRIFDYTPLMRRWVQRIQAQAGGEAAAN